MRLSILRRPAAVAMRAVRPAIQQVAWYHENVVDHYENPRNVGSFDKDASDVGTGLVGAPACGDVMKLQIKVVDGVVEDAKFKTFGCGSAIAARCVLPRARLAGGRALPNPSLRGGLSWARDSERVRTILTPSHALALTHARSSVASEWIKGKPIEECLELTNTDIAAHLKLPPVKLHCSMLAEDAIKAAVKDYRSKSESA